jgi:hypothetical protein
MEQAARERPLCGLEFNVASVAIGSGAGIRFSPLVGSFATGTRT